jgi:hypothetical protein
MRHYNHKMKRMTSYRAKKRDLLLVRDAAMGPRERVRLGSVQAVAARTVFMAGMAARGFTRAEALRAWRIAETVTRPE